MTSSTLYDILGIAPSATIEQIRKAYRSRAKSLHPDVNTTVDAGSKFSELATAYETLSDARRRAEYDLRLVQGTAHQKSPRPTATRQAHYTWSNIAAEDGSSSGPRGRSEFDELYETFFIQHPPTG